MVLCHKKNKQAKNWCATSGQGARAKTDKKSLCKGNKKHEKLSLILLGLDPLAEENRLQNHTKLLGKKLDRQTESYGSDSQGKACLEKWKIDLFCF